MARLCNVGGDAIWVSSNESKRAIELHEISSKAAHCDDSVSHLIFAYPLNKALCYVDDGELEEAEKCMKTSFSLLSNMKDNDNYEGDFISNICISSYIKTLLNRGEANDFRNEAYSLLLSRENSKKLTSWARNSLPIYVGKALQHAGQYSDAFKMYMQSHRYAIADDYIQVRAQVKLGKAQLYYLDKDNYFPEKSVRLLEQAYKLFKSIGAEGDIARVQSSLGSVFMMLGDAEKSREYFGYAELFYHNINASSQVARIRLLRAGERCI